MSAGVWPGGQVGPELASVVAGVAAVPGWAAITWAHWSSDMLWERLRGGGLAASPSHPTPPGVGSTMDVCGAPKARQAHYLHKTRAVVAGRWAFPSKAHGTQIPKENARYKTNAAKNIISCYNPKNAK